MHRKRQTDSLAEMQKNQNRIRMIGVIGSGSWATAIVKILLEKPQCNLLWWVRQERVCEHLLATGHNPLHLSSLQLDRHRLNVSTDLPSIVAAADTLVLAVPSVYLAHTLSMLPDGALQGKHIVSAIKGYEPESKVSVTEYLRQRYHLPDDRLCVVSGPSHAEEVAVGLPTFLTVASSNPLLANEVAQLLRCRYIHTQVSHEVHTIELCGLTKNVYAIAAGLASGLGYGDNLVAVLTTASAHELQDILPETTLAFRLLSDLLVTCFSQHSRNRALGEAVARGISPEAHFRQTGMVAEGYYSAAVMHSLPKPHPTPIAEAVYNILYHKDSPKQTIDQLIDDIR